MDALLLSLQAPLMSFGGPQVDQVGPTGRFPTVSQMVGLFANALGHTHADHRRLQTLQDRVSLAAALVHEGEEREDYQTVDLGQPHLAKPSWTTHGRPEHRAGGPDARLGTHIRFRRYRADAKVLAAVALDPPDLGPGVEEIAEALDNPCRPLFLGRKNCLPADRLVFGLCLGVPDLTDAISQARRDFPDRWAAAFGAPAITEVTAEWPITAEDDPLRSRSETHRVVDRRDWRNQLHGGERVVGRGALPLHDAEPPGGPA